MVDKKYFELRKANTIEELLAIPSGSEVILVHHGIDPKDSFTVHGKLSAVDRGSGHYVDVSEYVHLPLEFRFDTETPENVVDFLRGLSDPRFPRIRGMSFGGFSDQPSRCREIYLVFER